MRHPPPALLLVGVLLFATAPVGQVLATAPAGQSVATGPTNPAHGLPDADHVYALPDADHVYALPDADHASTADDASTDDGRCLVVENATSGEPLLTAPAPNGTAVALAYTHSVEKTRVVDGYEVRGDRLEMVRMEFASYGAGLPARAAVNRTGDGAFVFDPPGAYRELLVQPGRVAGHVLRVGDLTVDLVALSDASGVRLHLVSPGSSGSSADESGSSCSILDGGAPDDREGVEP